MCRIDATMRGAWRNDARSLEGSGKSFDEEVDAATTSHRNRNERRPKASPEGS
jgi:hypothetical protein